MKTWKQYQKQINYCTDIEKETIKQIAYIVSELEHRRLELGWTQEELAQRAGLKQSAIARLETESAIPRLDTLERVALALGLKVKLVNQEEAATAST